MKGVLLAGGTGSRLHPLTRITNKHLLPIYDRPMIAWSIEALVNAGIDRDHAGHRRHPRRRVPAAARQRPRVRHRAGSHYGYQDQAGGIAEALGWAEGFVDGDPVLVMLADNVMERSIKPMVDAFRADPSGARILLTAGGRARAPAPPRRAGPRR